MTHLLLLHGALGHPDYFADLIRQLENVYIVHTLTFAGHGMETLPENGIVMQHYVDQIMDYCEGLSTDKVSIFGYSMGGYAALCYAAAFPHKVAAVMTLATKLEWSPEIAAQETKMLQPELVETKVPGFAAYLSRLHGEHNWKRLMLGVGNLLQDLGHKPLLSSEQLKHITVKTQLMVGDRDNMVSISETQAAFKLMQDASLVVLPNTIHPFEKINIKLLYQLMLEFFRY